MTQIDESPKKNEEVPEDLKAAVAQAIKDQFAVTDAWRPKEKIRFIVKCPSGQQILCRHLTTMDLLEADLIEEIDFFTKRLFPVGLDAQGNPVEHEPLPEDQDEMASVWTLLKDVQKRARFFGLLNKIMVVGVVRPQIIDDGVEIVKQRGKDTVRLGVTKPNLQEGQALASAIDFADRMAIFAELNRPLNEIIPFRKEQAISLANLESMPKPESKTE